MSDPESTRPPLSILELVPVGQGTTPAAALANSVELARLGERLGYVRLWVAEHHNMPGIAELLAAGADRASRRVDRRPSASARAA